MLELKRPRQQSQSYMEDRDTSGQQKPVPTPVPTPGAASDVAMPTGPADMKPAQSTSMKPAPAPAAKPVGPSRNPTHEYDFHPKSLAKPATAATTPGTAPAAAQITKPTTSPNTALPSLAKPIKPGFTWQGDRPGQAGQQAGQPAGTTPPAYTRPDLGGVNPLGRAQVMDWRQGFDETRRDATTRQVNANELTSDQLNLLLDENGRYIQGARLRAREGAAGRGMMMSSVASGSAERAAIDAGMPIASQDAQAHFQTARDNMEAQNQFAIQDQAQGRQLLGQQVDLDFRGQESQMDRGFRREEGAIERNWRSGEGALDRGLQTFMQERGFRFQGDQNALNRELQSFMQERGFQFEGGQNALNRELQQFLQNNSQNWQSGENSAQRGWQSGENVAERGFRSNEAQRDRDFTGNQNDQARSQQRFAMWTEQQQRFQEQHANMVNGIMTNPNMTPEQQRIALDNLNGWFSRFREAGNAVFAAGVPEIFLSPYGMSNRPTQPLAPQQPAPGGAGTQPVITPIRGGEDYTTPAPQPTAPPIMSP